MSFKLTDAPVSMVSVSSAALLAIANVTGVIAAHDINIANLQAFRRKAGGDALIVLELDGEVDQTTVEQIRAFPEVQGVTFLVRRSDV